MKSRNAAWGGVLVVATVVMGGRGVLAEADASDTAVGASLSVSTNVIPDPGKVALRKGMDWLKSMQKEDGSWGEESYPAMTAFGLWAFARSDHPDKTNICTKAAKFVAGFAQQDGGIYKPATGGRGSGGLSTYNTAICMTALHLYDQAQYAQIVLKAREFMAHSQVQGDSQGAGGFGYDQRPPSPPSKDEMLRRMTERAKSEGKPAPTDEEIATAIERMAKMGARDRADLSNTGWALMAMRQTQGLEDLRPAGSKRVDVDWAAATNFMARLQNQDQSDAEHYGGFGYEQHGERGGTFVDKKEGTVKLLGYGSMTYAGMESMIYAQVGRNDPRVISSLKWAARHWSVDENPGMGAKGLFYYYNIMSKALGLVGSDVIQGENGKSIAWKQKLVAKLTAIQKAEGNWVNQDGQYWENNPVLVTSYVVLTLQNCRVQ